jgi:hypothetical protein
LADAPIGAFEGLRSDVVKQTGPHTYTVGAIQVDSRSREIRFPAKVNMKEGLIEVVVCTEYGKTHESIFVTSASPLHLHVALLLLGLKPGKSPGWYEHPDLPSDDARESGDLVHVYAMWETPEGERKVRTESLLKDIRTDEALPSMAWVFTGSLLDLRGAYAAQSSGSILTNYHDRTSVLDNPLEAGRIDDYTYARTETIPPVGTPVEVSIVPAREQKEEGNNGP